MEISRGVFHQLTESNWCFKCGDIKEFEPAKTDLPGISGNVCTTCKTGVRCNYLEDDSDLITLPEGFKVPEHCELQSSKCSQTVV